jgi:hypothetical protein
VAGFIRAMGNGDRKTVDIKEEQEVDYKELAVILKKTSAAL